MKQRLRWSGSGRGRLVAHGGSWIAAVSASGLFRVDVVSADGGEHARTLVLDENRTNAIASLERGGDGRLVIVASQYSGHDEYFEVTRVERWDASSGDRLEARLRAPALPEAAMTAARGAARRRGMPIDAVTVENATGSPQTVELPRVAANGVAVAFVSRGAVLWERKSDHAWRRFGSGVTDVSLHPTKNELAVATASGIAVYAFA